MDLINLLHNEMKDKHLSDLERMRYIYLRVCELFHFDTKWIVADIAGDPKLESKLAKKKIDLERIDDFSVICHTVSREVLFKLIREFTSYEARVAGNGYHSSLEVKDNYNNRWTLDPVYGDMAKVKLGIIPTGMAYTKKRGIILNDKDVDFGYIDVDLGYRFVKKESYKYLIQSADEKEIARQVGELLSRKDVRYHFMESDYFIDLFPAIACQNTEKIIDKDLSIHRIITLDKEYSDCISTILDRHNGRFELRENDGECVFEEIDEARYNKLTKELVYR